MTSSLASPPHSAADSIKRSTSTTATSPPSHDPGRYHYQQYLNQRWQQLCGNNPDVVMQTLEEAFEDNEAPAATAGVEASIAILIPPIAGAVPERVPGTTQAGNLTLRKLTQRERADFYKLFVCGQVLVTVREGLAVAPALVAIRAIVLRDDGRDAYGKPRVSCILAAKFDRAALAGIQWNTTDAAAIVNDAASEQVIQHKGRSQELAPLDLTNEPGIADLINVVDLEELADARTSYHSVRAAPGLTLSLDPPTDPAPGGGG